MKEVSFSQVKVGETVTLKKDKFAIYIRLADTRKGNSRFQPITYKGEQRGQWARFCSRWNCILLETPEEIASAIAAKATQYDT
jgi:hypothetical protein